MKWSRFFQPSSKKKQPTKKESSKGKGNITQHANESRQEEEEDVPKPAQPMMMGLASHHVSTNHLCGIKVSKCCNRALYDANR